MKVCLNRNLPVTTKQLPNKICTELSKSSLNKWIKENLTVVQLCNQLKSKRNKIKVQASNSCPQFLWEIFKVVKPAKLFLLQAILSKMRRYLTVPAISPLTRKIQLKHLEKTSHQSVKKIKIHLYRSSHLSKIQKW